MQLDERKIRILEAIINDYIVSAEPIGSRTIARKYDFGLSSATIRNEMSDLEDMGYILQPHTSAGRIPSDKGYRLYVDRLMRQRRLTEEESQILREIVVNNINQIDHLMRETARTLAHLTNYTTVAYEPRVQQIRLRHLQLLPLDEYGLMLICITDGNAVRNGIVRVSEAPSDEELSRLTSVLNAHMKGLSRDEIDAELIERLRAEFSESAGALEPIVDGIEFALANCEEARLYTSGIRNILAFPEFSDIERAREIFQALEEKDVLITLMNGMNGEQMKILIGSENSGTDMRDCSVIKAHYRLGRNNYGVMGIIGPTRMDYSQVVSILNGIVQNINQVIKTLEGDD